MPTVLRTSDMLQLENMNCFYCRPKSLAKIVGWLKISSCVSELVVTFFREAVAKERGISRLVFEMFNLWAVLNTELVGAAFTIMMAILTMMVAVILILGASYERVTCLRLWLILNAVITLCYIVVLGSEIYVHPYNQPAGRDRSPDYTINVDPDSSSGGGTIQFNFWFLVGCYVFLQLFYIFLVSICMRKIQQRKCMRDTGVNTISITALGSGTPYVVGYITETIPMRTIR